jgi:hypothetical protein
MGLADASEALGRKDARDTYLTRAIALYEDAERQRPTAGMVSHLFGARRMLAWALCERGDREHAGPLFAANHRLAESQSSESRDPVRGSRSVIAHIDWKLFLDSLTSAPDGEAGANLPGDSFPLARLASPADDSQSPQEWATIVAQAIDLTNPDAGGAAGRRAEDGFRVIERLTLLASHLRRRQEPTKARRIAERMLVLAEHLVATCPNQPESHLGLARAYLQLSKDGWPTNDWGAIEENLRLALVAA